MKQMEKIDEGVSYVALRMPRSLKVRIEDLAAQLDQSVNRTAIELIEAGLEAL